MSHISTEYNKQMAELRKRARVDLGRRSVKPRDIYTRLSSIWGQAKQYKSEGDEENAYVFCLRWLELVEHLKSIRNKEEKAFFTQYCTDTEINDVKRMMEDLDQSLRERYEAQTPNITVSCMMDAVESIQIDTDSSNDTDACVSNVGMPPTLPDLSTDISLDTTTKDVITCTRVYELMRSADSRILLIDIRTQDDYQASRIKTDKCVNIPTDQIKPGILACKYEKYLSKDKSACALFTHRSKEHVDIVILLDWHTTKALLTPNNQLSVLRTILIEWDPGVQYKRIAILEGGYTEWLNIYPTFTTNPNVKPPCSQEDAMDEILNDVEYPDWLDSPTVTKSSIAPHLGPMPPRNLKPTYTDQNHSTMDKMANNNVAPDQSQPLYHTARTSFYFNNLSDTDSPSNVNRAKFDEYTYSPSRCQRWPVHLHKVENDDANKENLAKDETLHLYKKLATKTNDVVIKPIVDRSSKPTSLKATSNDDSDAALKLMKQLEVLVKDQEKTNKEILNIESKIFSQLGQENRDPNEAREVESHLAVLRSKLEQIEKKNSEIKRELEKYKDKESLIYSYKERCRLDLSIGHAEQQLKTVAIERKKLYAKQAEMERSKILVPKVQRENDIHKEPLKRDGSPVNTGLKRSFSSPNLPQLDDHKMPQVDRSSKPKTRQQRNQNDSSNVNNKRTPIQRSGREHRMEPVYREVHPGITGLKNLGNSCYMNSIIQCLSNTACLAKYFNDSLYIDDLNTTNENGTQGQVAEEVAHVIRALWRGQYKSISPRDLKIIIGQYKLQFDSLDQQDSHEFLTFLLDWMHNDLKKKVKMIINEPLGVAEKEWDKAMDNQSSIISQLFFGQLRSSIICTTCGNSSTTYEIFNSLTMSLPDSARCTLDESIAKFMSGQKVSGWKCPNCKVAREATKKFDFVKLAPIVVIHLNRFGETGGWIAKRNTAVDFPLTGLNLKQYLVVDSDATTPPIQNTNNYNLYAMSNHYGTMDGGHYTAFCKSVNQKKWYKYDDQTVTEVSPSQIKLQSTSAYLLFYTSLPNIPYTFI